MTVARPLCAIRPVRSGSIRPTGNLVRPAVSVPTPSLKVSASCDTEQHWDLTMEFLGKQYITLVCGSIPLHGCTLYKTALSFSNH